MRSHPLSSLDYLSIGFRWLLKPGLKRYVFIPLLINIVLFSALFWLSAHYYEHFVLWLDQWIPHWLHFLAWALWLIFVVVGLAFISYTFTIFANIIGAPFNSFLSDKVESMLTGSPARVNATLTNQIADLPRSFWQQFKMLLYFIPRALGCLILFVIPVVHIAAGFLWFVLCSWMMALQYLDYPMDNHRLSFLHVRSKLSENRLQALSFGALIMLCSMIPILNFIIMPVSVIAATHWYVDHYHEKH